MDTTTTKITRPSRPTRLPFTSMVGCIALLLSSATVVADDKKTEDQVGVAIYKAAEDPHAAGLAIGAYGVKAGLEALGVDYKQLRQWVREATTHRLTNNTYLNLEPGQINIETRHFNGDLVTEFSTHTDGEVGLSVRIPF